MTRKLTLLLGSTAVFAGFGATALMAAVAVGDQIGTGEEEIRAKLAAAGYVIEEIETEDGVIEVDASMDGAEVEIEIAADTGAVLEVEAEDGDDDDDDEDGDDD